MGIDDSQQQWMPPTPRSNLVPLPSCTLPIDHLVLLPPPLLPHDGLDNSTTTTASRPRSVSRPSLPSLQPLLAVSSSPGSASLPTFASPAMSTPSDALRLDQEARDARLAASLSSVLDSASSSRPRRSAAIVAARNIPRQPSPFDLEDGDEADGGDPYPGEEDEDEDALSISPPPGGGSSSSRKRAGAASGGNAGGASKRKVSHSLIERRRREKINQCLQTLRETVPSLKEEGEKKMAKARERGRKRGRGDDAGERGGLHKLEILQGTILYIDDLRARIDQLEAAQLAPVPSRKDSSASSASGSSTTASFSALPLPSPDSLQELSPSTMPSPLLRASISSALEMSTRAPFAFPPTTQDPSPPSRSAELGVEDHEASMLLLNFSTSPELRPVQM
ncbi:hypothetical protein JCM8097_003703 [Rhodosporidiobolus ruineniae]